MAPHLLGRMLRGFRAGERHLAWNDPVVAGAEPCIVLTSAQFGDGGLMPTRCAGKGVGDNVSPSLSWTGVPADAEELILIMEDPDAPLLWPVVHLIATGIAPETTRLAEGALSSEPAPDVFRFGVGSFGRRGYQGPRPVPGHGPHRYIFALLAIRQVTFSEPPTLATMLAMIAGRVLARGRLVGLYER